MYVTCQQLATNYSTSWINNTQTRTKASQVTSNWPRNSVSNLTVSLPLKDNGCRLNYSIFSYQLASSTPKVNKQLLHATLRTSLLLLLNRCMPHFSLNTTPETRNGCPWMLLPLWRLFLLENRNVLTEERSAWYTQKICWFETNSLADLLCVTQSERSAVSFFF